MTSIIIPTMITDHLKQLLSSEHSSIMSLSWSGMQGSLCSSWSCRGQERMTMTFQKIPDMITDHLEPLLFLKHCPKMLYLDFVVKFCSSGTYPSSKDPRGKIWV